VKIDIAAARERLEVERRVRDIPRGATVRGVWFGLCAEFVRRLGPTQALAWRSAVHGRRVPFRAYPLREYIEESAIGAAIVNADDPREGMHRMWRRSSSMYLETPFGRSLLRLLRPSPLRYLQWLVDHRDHFCNYGRWRLVKHGDGHVTMEMEREYIWIEHAHRGGAEGVLDLFGLEGTVEPELSSAYEGRLHIRWRPRPNG
jgi:uncharacterized protein (TIGR02265 family)